MAVDCAKCVNNHRCRECVHFRLLVDLYDEGPVGGIAHNNCDGCARVLPVVDGLHHDNGRPFMACTANRYKGEP